MKGGRGQKKRKKKDDSISRSINFKETESREVRRRKEKKKERVSKVGPDGNPKKKRKNE